MLLYKNSNEKPSYELSCKFEINKVTSSIKGLKQKLIKTKPEEISIKINNLKYNITKDLNAKKRCINVFNEVVKHQKYKIE